MTTKDPLMHPKRTAPRVTREQQRSLSECVEIITSEMIKAEKRGNKLTTLSIWVIRDCVLIIDKIAKIGETNED